MHKKPVKKAKNRNQSSSDKVVISTAYSTTQKRDSLIVITAQLTLYFFQEQGESAEFTSVNEHFPGGDWRK
jgi:hypothetical protein